jgi:hypothetical protein
MIDPPIRSLSIPYFILIKERIGSIAFLDDFRGDIFLIFITPKDDRRVKKHFQKPFVMERGMLTGLGYCLTFVLTSGICYKIIFFNLRGAQGLFRKKCAVFKKIKEKKI